jgi:hypothetical protein
MKTELEETAEKLYPVSPHKRKIWLEGAKWQAERSYSEKEILRIIQNCKEYLSFGDEFDEIKWFEQFKKK